VYAVTDLGTVGGDYAAAMALNEWGHVVGYSRAADGRMRAFHWAAGTMRDLGTYRGRRNSYGHGLNDAGVAVGLTLTAADRSRGIVWTAGRARDLGALAGGESAAEAINNRGQIVGYATIPDGTPTGDTRAVLWEAGGLRELRTPGAWFCQAVGINDAGVVIGALLVRVGDIGRTRAFIIDTRADDALRLLDPLPGDDECFPNAINDAGQVAGVSELLGRIGERESATRAFLHTDGATRELRPPPGYYQAGASALNNHGQVVGSGAVEPGDDSRASRALLWREDAVLDLNDLDLLDPGWILTGAVGINDAGQILANAQRRDLTRIEAYRGTQTRAFLLTPSPETPSTSDTMTEQGFANTP
jgi:probable HAF family extracellular repeat protein